MNKAHEKYGPVHEILVYIYIVLSTEYSIWNLSSNNPMISEKKMLRYIQVALGERSAHVTFGAYIKPVFH